MKSKKFDFDGNKPIRLGSELITLVGSFHPKKYWIIFYTGSHLMIG